MNNIIGDRQLFSFSFAVLGIGYQSSSYRTATTNQRLTIRNNLVLEVARGFVIRNDKQQLPQPE